MERILITVGCLLLAGWQFYVSYGNHVGLKLKATKIRLHSPRLLFSTVLRLV